MQNQIINMCRVLIGPNAVVTDDQINDAIERVSLIFPNMDIAQVKSELLSLYGVRIQDFQILEGNERRQPWLRDFKAERKSTWDFWVRYKQYLSEQKGFAPLVIQKLDEMSDRILDNLFNPQLTNITIDKKGLVVGQVQSGKTANYTGLICKAADAGFNFIVVLAGILNNLRSQTQSRIDEGFLGFDTQYERAYNINNTTKIGVGLIPGFDSAIANSYTTSLDSGDFNSRAANTAGFNFNAPQPIILVVKKNASVLKRLNTWLKAQAGGHKIANKSLLLIDDEADNASINTKKDKDLDPTAINKGIRTLIGQFNRSAYVGYTATPFANIFIAQDESDLFPRDFIINLPAPTNYIGPEKVFGTSMDVEEEEDLLPIVVPISDYLTFIPEGHKKNDPKPTFADIPESLKTAIKSFILTCAIRLARGQENKHNSMLIHVSRYQLWQNEIKELVAQQFSYYKQEIEANDPSVLSEFQDLLENDYTETTNKIKNSTLSNIDHCLQVHQWEDIKPLLFKVVQKIEVKSINGSSGDIVDYQLNSKNGVSVIAIGGDKLSRGLTLEGLSISYFLRASKMYDTLMQMGRWFGYRPGYVDLCRLFTSAELNEWYRHIAIASAELREEFNYLAESRSTPDKYALKVRTHPGCLQITALNKMRNTKEIQVSWASRLIETYQLPIDKGLKNRNLVATDELLAGLGEPIIKDGDYLWKNVPANQICDYFNEFTVAESLKKLNLELNLKYINELQGHNELTNWSVALMNKSAGSGPNKEYRFCNKYKVNCFYRNRAIDTDYKTYFIRKNHIVGNQADEFVDLEKDMLNEALETTKRESVDNGKIWSKAYPKPLVVRSSFRPKTQPLLIIYPLNPIGANVMKNGVPAEGSTVFVESDDPFVGFAISFPATDTSFAVNYKVNMVGEYADIEDNFDNENDNEYRE